MKIIIIGSKGFIGSHLLNYCRNLGHEVWGADVIVDYIDKSGYFLIDASNSDYNSIFQSMEYDVCVNCSGAASVPESFHNPMRDFYLNSVNVFKLLEAIKRHQNDCSFLNLSSAAVYGNPEVLPIKETANLQPLSPYGTHKLQAEQICTEFYDFYKIKTCSARIFSVYGPGLKKQIFWDLFNKAQTSDPLVLYGTGKESRDFIYIMDLVNAIELVLKHSEFTGNAINIANGEEVFINDAASIFLSFFDHQVTFSFSEEIRGGDPVNWMADITKLRAMGYQQTVDINTGLKEYYNWITGNNIK